MLLSVSYILIGLLLLFLGGEFLITGSLRISRHFRISPFVVGATIMGFGTSAPELAVSMIAAIKGQPELSIGNVVGSNIANIGLVLGLAALLTSIPIKHARFHREAPPMLIATLIFCLMAWDQTLSRLEGFLLFGGIAFYIWRTLQDSEEFDLKFEDTVKLFAKRPVAWQFVMSGIGLCLLVLGARAMVEGSVDIARSFGISEWLIGISILAVGTSLPEIVSSTMSARRGHADLALGNVFGSNLFNILMVLGSAASIHPMVLHEMIRPDLSVMAGMTVLLLLLILRNLKLSRLDGCILLACYAGYMAFKGISSL